MFAYLLLSTLCVPGAIVEDKSQDKDASSNSGFTKCSCHIYQNYAWCLHSALYAIQNKAILALPMLKDGIPNKLGRMSIADINKKKRSRPYPARAERGGALSRK